MRLLHTERRWDGIPESPLTANGQEDGIITVEDTAYYKAKMYVVLKSDTHQPVRYQIQRVLSRTQMIIGLTPQEFAERRKKQKNTLRIVDATRWLVSDNATIEAPEQERPNIPHEDYERAVYEEEPVMAKRIVPVNEYGQINSPDNPLYTQLSDGDINIGTVNAEVEVQLNHRDNDPDAGDVADKINVIDGFLQRKKEVINNITYEGVAVAGSADNAAEWRITRTIKQLDGSFITQIVGDTNYDAKWSERASLFPAETPIEFFDRKYEQFLPILANANWMKIGNFTSVRPSFTDENAILDYYEDEAYLGKATIRWVDDKDWQIDLERYINDDDGDILLDDNDEPLNLD